MKQNKIQSRLHSSIKLITFFLLTATLTSSLQASCSYDELVTKENVIIKYRWKKNKEGKQELRIKFKNKTKSAVNVNTEVAFYSTGVLEETAQLNVCLKKCFLDNWFRPVQIVNYEAVQKLNNDDFKIEITEFKAEKVDECRATHK